MPADEKTRKIWLALADLFFVDCEPQELEFQSTIKLLREAGWSAEKTRQVLIELIAPVAGINLGFLIYPAIGDWTGFNKAWLCERVERRIKAREKYPRSFRLSEWWCARMLRSLGMEEFLTRLGP